jgi:hypothetical protein
MQKTLSAFSKENVAHTAFIGWMRTTGVIVPKVDVFSAAGRGIPRMVRGIL